MTTLQDIRNWGIQPVGIVGPNGLPVSSTNPIPVGTAPGGSLTAGYFASATFTPAAAAYNANDVISVAQTFTWTDLAGNVFPGGMMLIVASSILISETALQSGETSYNLQKYNVTPPSAHADNAAWDLPSGDRAAYQGATSLGTPVDIGSSLYLKQTVLQEPIIVPATGLTFGELITVGAATLTATARKAVLFGVAI